MVWIHGGTFRMGSDEHYPEEAPTRRVTVGGFWIDRHAAPNREFERFVRKTGYVSKPDRSSGNARAQAAVNVATPKRSAGSIRCTRVVVLVPRSSGA
jgi:formylglycine-generating enzyme required for sulfatase activity